MIETTAAPTPIVPATRAGIVGRDDVAFGAQDLPVHAIACDGEACPVCGMAALVTRRCKVVCRHCLTILQSCADL